MGKFGFQLADQEYAFSIDQVREIVILEQITRVPQTLDYIEGAVIPVISRSKRIPACLVCLLFA